MGENPPTQHVMLNHLLANLHYNLSRCFEMMHSLHVIDPMHGPPKPTSRPACGGCTLATEF